MANFKVKRGRKFFMGPRWNFFSRKTNEFNSKAYFHEDCNYRLAENYDQINKLSGQSFRVLPWFDKSEKKIRPGHHMDSVRFGWRCVDGENIELLSYVYIDGSRKHKPMGFVKLGSWVHLNFKETNSYYSFKIISDSGDAYVSKFKKKETRRGFLGLFIHRLYPYFGGKIAAPHNMTIEVKYLKKMI